MTVPIEESEELSRTLHCCKESPRFRESLIQRLRRFILGSLYALRPDRLSVLPRIWLLTIAYILFPQAERDEFADDPRFYSKRGFVGVSSDLSVDALVANYGRGFFPVCHIGPMKWWCPEQRAVIDPAQTHVSRNIHRLLRQNRFKITMDIDFAGVMEGCARPRPGKVPLTWITPTVMRAFWDAHQAGYAHSVEVWDSKGKLVGGLYGLAIGKVFFGESQFSSIEHTSKIAVVALHRHLATWDYRLRDAKWITPHLVSFGFRTLPREQFLSQLANYLLEPGREGRWELDPVIDLTPTG